MPELKPDHQESLSALRFFYPEGAWVLTAIHPNGKSGATSATFAKEKTSDLLNWTDVFGEYNQYFTVNPLLSPMGPGQKAKKTDVKEMAFLHVDIDPRPKMDFEAERARILKLLREFEVPPSIIIDSGGGYQGFWRLETPIPINGDLNKAAEAEAYNLQLELRLGADSCHNCDRIMRLPGTINWPNEKKKAKGRVPALAKIVAASNFVYPISRFTPAPRVQTSPSSFGSGPEVVLSGNLPKLGSLDELPEKVTDRTKMLIVQGDDPDEPGKYASRSEVVFAVCCALVRAGVADDQIAAILLDPDFAISGHVLAQRRPQNYAARQIQRAKEEAVNPWLRKLNEKHAVVEDVGGKCRVVSEIEDVAMKRTRLSLQTFDDFRNRYMHIKVDLGQSADGERILVPLGKYWLLAEDRRQYGTIVFAPNREVNGAYNLWRGFGCEARPGNFDTFMEHMKENICGGDVGYFEYLLNWMARCVQKPDSQGEVAIVLRGSMGTGKSVFAKTFGALFGRHFLPVSDPKHLVGSFNAHLRDCLVLFGDEAFFAGDKRHESVLKTLITEDTLVIEKKGVDAEVSPNFVHLILSSNNDWVIPAGANERRFFVLDVANTKMQDTSYFAKIAEEMKAGGYEALLYFLLNRDISQFEVRQFPKTRALQDQKLLSLGPMEEWWFERLNDGRITRESPMWAGEIAKDDLHTDYLRYLERQKHFRRASPTTLGKFLKKIMPGEYPKQFQKMASVPKDDGFGNYKMVEQMTTFYEVPPLEECRSLFEQKFGGNYEWIPVRNTANKEHRAPF